MLDSWKDALYHFERAAKMKKGEKVEENPLDVLYELIEKTGAKADGSSINRHRDVLQRRYFKLRRI